MKRTSFIILLIGIVLLFKSSAAYSGQLDSLKLLLAKEKQDCKKAQLSNLLSEELQLLDIKEAMRYAESAFLYSKDCLDKKATGIALLNKAAAFDLIGNYAEALKNALNARKIFEENAYEDLLARCLHRLGIISYHQSETVNRGNKTKFYEDALKFYNEALAIEQSLGNQFGIVDNSIEIGYVKFNMGDLEGGLSILNNALIISEGFPLDKKYIHNVAKASYNISLIYIAKDSIMQAIHYLSKAVAADSILGNKEGLAGIRMAELYMVSGNNKKAIELAQKNYDTAFEYGYKLRQKQASEVLFKALAKEEKFEEAYQYLLMNKTLSDSLKNEEHTKDITTLELNYEFEKKEKHQKEERQKEIAKTNLILFSGLCFLLVTLLTVVLIYRNYRKKQKHNQQLQLAYNIIEEKTEDILGSIRYAKRIQDAILPPQEMIESVLPESFVLFKPKDVVSGDFYWVEHREEKVFFAVVDCTGHGVPGAFMSIIGHHALHNAVNEFKLDSAGLILDKMNEIVEETLRQKGNTDIRDGMDISLCVLKKENGKKILEFAGANNPLYILIDKELTEIKGDKQPIGAYENKVPFSTHTIQIKGNETFFLFTDGYADQFGGDKGKKFMYRSFKQLLISINKLSPSEQKEQLDKAFENWKKDFEQIDDICVMGVRI